MVEDHTPAIVRRNQGLGCEEVRVDDVPDVGVVEEVVSIPELEMELPVWSDGGGGQHTAGEAAVVALADDAGGADGAGEEVVVCGGAVGGDDERFGDGFGFAVVFNGIWDDEGVGLGGGDKVRDGVVDDGGGGRVDEGFDW